MMFQKTNEKQNYSSRI